MFKTIAEWFLIFLTRQITGAYPLWQGCKPLKKKRIYYANHTSHGDLLIIWAALPSYLRKQTKPVGGADYWLKTKFRRFLAEKVYNAVLVIREGVSRHYNPIDVMSEALDEGYSLIIFPEGTRNITEEVLLPFKSGLYWLCKRYPDVEVVPVWLENPYRAMPKGEILPIPLLCSATFGEPIFYKEKELKNSFLMRAEEALKNLIPEHSPFYKIKDFHHENNQGVIS